MSESVGKLALKGIGTGADVGSGILTPGFWLLTSCF